MPDGQVLEFAGVSKQFGTVTAVSGFSARIEPGLVTGFLGPNGAGKTTSLRIMLGLVRASQGTATIGGLPYAKLREPLETVGAVLEASSFHPGRTAANHLKIYAQAAGLSGGRIEEVLGMVGLAEVGGSKVGGFSLGMKQRLSLAYALLGDPGVLILDEPANGLDPEGIIWMRSLLRELARQGRTVLVSSHLLAEVQQTVDALLIIAQGRLVFQGGLEELTDPGDFVTVVDSPDRAALSAALGGAGVAFEVLRSGVTVRGAAPADIGAVAAAAGVGLSLLQRRGPGLEDVFLDLVNGTRVHPSAGGDVSPLVGADDGLDAAAAPSERPADAVIPAEAAEEVVPVRVDANEDAADAPVLDGRGAAEDVPAPGDDPSDGLDTDAAPVLRPEESAPAAGPSFAVAGTGVIDIVTADDAVTDDEAPDVFEPDSVTDLAPGAAADDADPSTGDVIVAASDDPSTSSGTGETSSENAETSSENAETSSENAETSSENADTGDAVDGTELENRQRPPAQRWEAQFDPVADPTADDEVSDSDAEADEFFAASPVPELDEESEPADADAQPARERKNER